MTLEFRMPQLGESGAEGTIGRWLKKPGDRVQEHEPLLEVITDKVDSELSAPATGVLLEIRAQEGETVRAGAVLARIGEEEESPVQPEATAQPPVEAGEPGEQKVGRGYLTPVVARMAAEHGIDVLQVQGSGRQGRVTKKDMLRYLEQHETAPARQEKAPLAESHREPGAGDVEVPLSPMRQAIVRHMRQSKDTAAHVTTIWEVDLSRVVAYRQAQRAAFEAEGIRLTYTPFFLEAIVAGLKAYPMLNSVLEGDRLIYRRAIHLGVAVDLGEEGLIVPVVRNADEKNLRGLARAVTDLAERARAHKLSAEDVQGGTFSLTNHGVVGSLAGTPIIPMPQVAILGVGAMQKRAVVLETDFGESIAIRPMAYLSLSFDHRAIDGATADRFMAQVKAFLESYD